MDLAALFISIISALGTGAAAVIAWTSRADALKSAESATAASKRANDAWEATATSLAEANRLTVERDEAAQLADRKVLAASIRSWVVSEGIRRSLGQPDDPVLLEERRDLAIRISGSLHPNASIVDRAAAEVISGVQKGDLPVAAMQSADLMIREWVTDPAGFDAKVDADAILASVNEMLAESARKHQLMMRGDSADSDDEL